MQNKFGFKDFVLMVLVVVVGVLTFMNMRQGDRQWRQNQDVISKVSTVEQQLAKLERNLQTGQVNIAPPGDAAHAGSQGVISRDESWARPGEVPVQWQPNFDLESPPTTWRATASAASSPKSSRPSPPSSHPSSPRTPTGAA